MATSADGSFAWEARALRELAHNYLDERSARRMYLALAALDGKGPRAAHLRELAEFETKHAALWESLLRALGQPVPAQRPFFEHRMLVGLARLFGVGAVLALLHRGEAEGIGTYEAQASAWKDPRAQAIFAEILPDEFAHEIDLFGEMRDTQAGREGLRSTVLGANDGLGSVLALAAGVAGATSSNSAVLVAGLAGLVAGAVSMGASNFVSVRAEKEAYEAQATLEGRAALAAPSSRMARVRAALLARGLEKGEAEAAAKRLASRPEDLRRAVLADLPGAGAGGVSAPRLAMYTGLAFLVAGTVPLVPFLLFPMETAVVLAVFVTGLALFTTGLLRALSALSRPLRSGAEMVLVGLGSAAATFVVGLLVGTSIA